MDTELHIDLEADAPVMPLRRCSQEPRDYAISLEDHIERLNTLISKLMADRNNLVAAMHQVRQESADQIAAQQQTIEAIVQEAAAREWLLRESANDAIDDMVNGAHHAVREAATDGLVKGGIVGGLAGWWLTKRKYTK